MCSSPFSHLNIHGKKRIASADTEKYGKSFAEHGKVRYIFRMAKTEKKPARFAQRRDVWMRNLLLSDLPSGAKVIGIRLALYMNEGKQWAHPSYDTLGDACGLKARQAQTNCFVLEENFWITIQHKRNAGNTYWLRYWWEE